MGTMGSDRDPAVVEAERRERAARKEQVQRERHDAKLRADMIRDGRDRPDNEFLGLGVVIHGEDVLVWSTTIKHVLGPLNGAQAGIAGSIKTRGAGTAVAATVAFGALGAIGALGARGSKPFAYVVFPDGTLHQNEISDKRVATRAQADVLRFNALISGQAGLIVSQDQITDSTRPVDAESSVLPMTSPGRSHGWYSSKGVATYRSMITHRFCLRALTLIGSARASAECLGSWPSSIRPVADPARPLAFVPLGDSPASISQTEKASATGIPPC